MLELATFPDWFHHDAGLDPGSCMRDQCLCCQKIMGNASHLQLATSVLTKRQVDRCRCACWEVLKAPEHGTGAINSLPDALCYIALKLKSGGKLHLLAEPSLACHMCTVLLKMFKPHSLSVAETIVHISPLSPHGLWHSCIQTAPHQHGVGFQ